MGNTKLTYDWNQEIVIIHLPQIYFVGSWGEMLELVRKKTIVGSKYIIIDLSEVKSVQDCGGEFYILREEYRDIGGKEVLISGMPDFFHSLFKYFEDDSIEEKIKKFRNTDEAVSWIKANS